MTLAEAMKIYDEVEIENNDFGACERETRALYETMVVRAYRGDFRLGMPRDPQTWRLYERPGSKMAARKLARAAYRVVEAISISTFVEQAETRRTLLKYLRLYCC